MLLRDAESVIPNPSSVVIDLSGAYAYRRARGYARDERMKEDKRGIINTYVKSV